MDSHKNFAYSLVATAPSPATSGTSLVVTTGQGALFPPTPFNATIWPTGANPTTTNAEIVRVTGISTDTLTIVRAQESSSARTVVVGDQIAATITKKSFTDIETLIPNTVLSLTQNTPLSEVAGTVVSKAGTITGTAGVGSSLFLQRIMIPTAMNLSEIQIALSLGFPNTSQGAGTMSRSFILYSLGNSTSLASIISASGTSAWNTGTSTAGTSVSLTQFQGGWSSPLIQPMTFASSSVAAGEYVVGQLFNFAQASSTWTLNLYGAQAVSSVLASAATNLTSATLGAMSSGGLSAGSFHSASGSTALTAFTATPTVANVMLSAALLAGSFHTASSSSSLTAWSAAPANMAFAGIASTAGFSTTNVSTFTAGSQVIKATATSAATASLLVNAGTSAFAGFLGSGGLLAGSFFTAATGSSAVLANAGTAAVNLLSSNGLVAASAFTSSNSIGAVTNVALGALNSSTLAQATFANFGFIGTGSTTSGFPTAFMAGIMSTGALPTAITLTSTAVTYSGSFAFQNPWFALLGA